MLAKATDRLRCTLCAMSQSGGGRMMTGDATTVRRQEKISFEPTVDSVHGHT